MTELGKHLLGRIPSPPDDRDFELRHWLETDDALEAALAQLQASHAAASTKAWAAVATRLIEALQPPSPSPDPQPTPSPTPDPPPTPPAPPSPPPVADVLWRDPDPPLDQGNFGTCTGNGTAQFLNTDPIEDHDDEKVARAIYYEATVLDGAPDDPDAPGGGQQGATVRSGMKALRNRKRVASFAAAASTDEITAWLRTKGPVVVGTDWTADMFSPDANGFVRPTGAVEGGHCYLLVGVSADGSTYQALNSWGSNWGEGGYFKIAVADFAKLLASGGEAWAASELPL